MKSLARLTALSVMAIAGFILLAGEMEASVFIFFAAKAAGLALLALCARLADKWRHTDRLIGKMCDDE